MRRAWIVILAGGCTLGLTGACGGEDEAEVAKAGAGGEAGSGTGGAAAGTSSGGSSGAATGGASGAGTGGSAQAGTAGAAGAGGGASGASGAGGAAGCPAQQPQGGAECTAAFGTSCTYGDQQCACFRSSGSNTPTWSCYNCPATQPADDSSCSNSGGPTRRCKYDATNCMCSGGDWDCGSCPTAQPTNMTSCSPLNGMQCAYDQTQCSCSTQGGNWFCSGGTSSGCPQQEPNPGGSCNLPPTQVCNYSGGDACYCINSQWFCNN
jgi:hypothetical protein